MVQALQQWNWTRRRSRSPTGGSEPLFGNHRHARTVVSCYSAVDKLFPACGLLDLTEGIYGGDPNRPLAQAQAEQHRYLLDQVSCRAGRRVLDIGCGYGTLLERIGQRGAMGVGITNSPEQAGYCRRKGLDVRLLDYRQIPTAWDGSFDAVVANGSIEHFVRPVDAAKGIVDDIYRDMFARVHRLFDASSPARKFVTTTIHFVRKPSDPLAILRSPFVFRWGSDSFHWSVLERGWGGYYPEAGQLRHCAEGFFELIAEVDGTEDYLFTSVEWLRRLRRAFTPPHVWKTALRSLPVLARRPRQFLTLLMGALISESWSWQFRPPLPPTRLLRQTWAYQERQRAAGRVERGRRGEAART